MKKITLKKACCHNDAFWEIGHTIEAEDNFAAFLIGIGDAVVAAKDAELTPRPDPGPARRTLETDAMEKAAASIVTAVAKAATGKKGAEKDA